MTTLTTTAEARDRTAFNRLSISKPAEKQLAGLPARKRQNVCAALTEPICEWRTQKLKQLGDVWRIRIHGEGAVRVVYQADGDAAHIVFVGEHDSYDSFRRSWDGQVRGQHVSLTESEIVMKTLQKHAKNAKNNNGQSVARSEVPATPTLVPATAPVTGTPAAEMLWHGMLSLVAGAVEQQVDTTLHPLFELEREKTVNDVLQGLPDRSREQKALNDLKSDFGNGMRHVRSAVKGFQETLDVLADVVAAELHAIRDEVGERDSQHAESFGRVESLLEAAGQASNQLDDRQEQTLQQLGRLESRIGQSQQHWDTAHGEVLRVLRETEQREARLSETLQELSHHVGSVALPGEPARRLG